MKKVVFTVATLALIGLSNNGAKAQVLTTVAGTSGLSGSFGDGGTATLARLYTPNSSALDGAGNLYIADEFNHRIRMVNTNGIISTVAGNGTAAYSGDGGAATAAKLNQPMAVACDAAGNFYIADYGNHRIRKVTKSTGIISTIAGNGTQGFSGDLAMATAAQLNYPDGLTLDPAGNLYIADMYNFRIRKVTSTGVISTYAGNGTQGYLGDGGTAVAAELYYPAGLTFANFNIYIADKYNHVIRMVNAGIISTVAGTGGLNGFAGDGAAAINAQLYYPTGVAFDANGNMYIADMWNNRIRKVNTAGTISTFVSGLSSPTGVAFDASKCNLYVTNQNDNTVQRTPVVTTIVNSPTVCAGTTATLTASGATNYNWSPATGLSATTGSTVTSTNTGTTTTYTVHGTVGTCFNDRVSFITVNALPTLTLTSNSYTICNGGSQVLSVSGAITYTWNTSATGASITPSPTVTTGYTVTGTDGNTCKNTATTTITVNALPTLTLTVSSPTICAGGAETLSVSGASTYTWNTSETSSLITPSPTLTTSYNVTGTDGNGCTNTATATVTVNALPPVTANSAIICVGATTTLTANGATTYTWNTSETTTFITPSPTVTTNYTVTGTDGNGCVNNYVTTIYANALPPVTVNSSTICFGNMGYLSANGANTYLWSTTETMSNIMVTPAVTTDYIVTGTDGNGCKNTATSTVTVNPLPAVTINSPTICAGRTATLTANGAVSYIWMPGGINAATIIVSPSVTTTYTVTGTDANTCTNTATAIVTMVMPVTPAICMVTTDSVTNYAYNIIYWNKTGYTNVDSFLVYRKDNSSGNYLRIGAVSKDSLSEFTDTQFNIGGPNGGNPQIAAWRYKLAIKDTCGNISSKSPYHQSVFVTESGSTFNFSAYIDSVNVSLPTGYGLYRDDTNTGNYQLVAAIGSSPASDPSYSIYPNANWRVDALGFNCTPTLRLSGNNSTDAAKIKSHSNQNNNRTTGINRLANSNTVNIYPNPAKGEINLTISQFDNTKTNSIEIYNTIGDCVHRQIATSSNCQIDVSDLAEGIYNISVISNEGTVNKRVVILR